MMKIPSLSSGSTGGEKFSVNTDKISNRAGGVSEFIKALDNIERKAYHEDLQRLIEEVDKMGQKLAKSCTITDLRNYKRAVKNFLKETIGKAYEARNEAGWDRTGRQKIYVLVKKVDKNLEDLSQEIMQEHTDSLNVLKKIDEIRGLLVDMYM